MKTEKILGYMKLEDIGCGLRVKSKITGNTGTVVSIEYRVFDIDKIGWIQIAWDNGNITSQPYFDPDYGDEQAFNNIEVIEEF